MEKDKTIEKNSEFQKPNKLLYKTIAAVVRFMLWIKLRPTYKTDELRKIDGAAVVMCSHTSNLDFLLLAIGLLPVIPTYIMSNHFFTNPKTAKLLNPLHAIPKKMFCADINAVRQVMKAIKAGNSVIMFPEGRLSCCGHTMQIADGTAELIKKLGVDVYWFTENGLYKALPKWGKAGIRKGPVSVEGGLLWKADELKSMSVAEIEEGLTQRLRHDDEKVYVGERYKCKKPALGLEGILYKCPECGVEFKMVTDDRHIKCTECGAEWELSESYVLKKMGDSTMSRDTGKQVEKSFSRKDFCSINDWFDWQQELIDIDAGLETDCTLATPDETGLLNRSAGKGHISINREEIHYVGTCWDEPFEFTEKTSVIKAFPVSVGDHFDIYSNRIMYNIITEPEINECVKWVQYLDKLEGAER